MPLALESHHDAVGAEVKAILPHSGESPLKNFEPGVGSSYRARCVLPTPGGSYQQHALGAIQEGEACEAPLITGRSGYQEKSKASNVSRTGNTSDDLGDTIRPQPESPR